MKNTASLYGREKKERKTLRNAAEQQKKNERDGKKGGKGGGHDSACWMFREPTKRAESIHTKRKITKKRRERERDGSIGQAFLECVARRHFVGWPERFFLLLLLPPFLSFSLFLWLLQRSFLCVTHSSSLLATKLRHLSFF